MTPVDVGLDLGATLTKAVAVPADSPIETFETFICPAADPHLLDAFLERRPPRILAATGGGSGRLARRLSATRDVDLVGEFESWGSGEALLLGLAGLSLAVPHVLVSLGTGTSILLVDGPGTVRRVGGTALGGGTLRGLGILLLGEESHDALVSLAARGDRRQVDLLVGDLYGPGEIALVPELTAANFGKVDSREPADVANALIGLLGENVALLAGELALRTAPPADAGAFRGRPDVVYAGSTLRNNPLLEDVLRAVTALVGASAHFLPRGEFTGACGALARARGRRSAREGREGQS